MDSLTISYFSDFSILTEQITCFVHGLVVLEDFLVVPVVHHLFFVVFSNYFPEHQPKILQWKIKQCIFTIPLFFFISVSLTVTLHNPTFKNHVNISSINTFACYQNLSLSHWRLSMIWCICMVSFVSFLL